MKTPHFYLKAGLLFFLPVVLLTCGTKVLAQTTDSNLIPVVTVQATQPIATVTNPGVFTLFRAGNTNATLNVWYDLGGTASNGVDYAPIPPHLVEIAAGATSNTIVITPLASTPSSVAKTVVLTLTNSPLMTPVNYEIGSPSSAMVYIEANGATNLPPLVSIIRTEGWRRVLHADQHSASGEGGRPGRLGHQRRIFCRHERPGAGPAWSCSIRRASTA